MEIGADSLQTRLAGDLVVLQQQLDSPTMWATAARALTTYGKTTKDPTEAIGWYDTARIAADRSDDLAIRVWVRGRIELHRALMMTKSGDRSGGLAYARRAWATLPADRRSQTLGLVLQEVERAARQPT